MNPGLPEESKAPPFMVTENQVVGFIYKKNLHFIYRYPYCSNFPLQ